MDEKVINAEFVVQGFVQGVGFRFFAYRKAIELGINGYVSNLYDGSVKVVAVGGENAIREFHQQLITGPSRASVTNVSVVYTEVKDTFDNFTIK